MNIREFTFNLQKLYADMSSSFSSFQNKSGLNCPPECGRCCLNPEVEASVLEMLPLALKIHDEGKVDEWLTKLETSTQNYCLLFVPKGSEGKGSCGSYGERPSVCRMFGVAGTFNKHGEKTLSICKFIKEEQEATVKKLSTDLSHLPMLPDWSYKLSCLDPDLLKNKIPMNEAIKEALLRVSLYAQYQDL